jgi:hypothetical protein
MSSRPIAGKAAWGHDLPWTAANCLCVETRPLRRYGAKVRNWRDGEAYGLRELARCGRWLTEREIDSRCSKFAF